MKTATWIRLLCLVVLLHASIGAAQTNLIGNGGFESPDITDYLPVFAGEVTIPSWSVSLESVDVVDVINPFTSGPAWEGTQYLDLDGTPGPGRISQTFVTIPGEWYRLFFVYANNYGLGQTAPSATVRVYDSMGARLGTQMITHSSSLPEHLDWTGFTADFTALETLTTLEFASLSSGGFNGIFLDGLRMTAVPEPSAILLLAGGAGVGALGFSR